MAVECLSRQDALDLLHHCLMDGEVVPGKHFRIELTNERLEMDSVIRVMSSGAIFDEPERDSRSEWKYKVEGYEPDGKWLVVVFTFKTTDRAFLITVWSVTARSRQ
jgi:uncharacterized DUF497 family protein